VSRFMGLVQMNPEPLIQSVLSFANSLTPIVNLITMGGLLVALARVVYPLVRGTAPPVGSPDNARPSTSSAGHPRRITNHPLIFSAALAALVSEGVGFVVFSSPLIASSAQRTMAANAIAIVGLGISLVAWLPSLYVSLHLAPIQRWTWFVGLLLGGLLLYIPALTRRDFVSYCLVGAMPAIYAVFGPRSKP
jgi:hypothetical protein